MTSIPQIRRNELDVPLTMVTAYDYPTAQLVDQAGVDLVLVGDSAATVVLGRKTTSDVGMDEMLLFVEAVARGTTSALTVADMPFMSYQPGDRDAVVNAGRFIRAGADAVKLEGAGSTIERMRAVTASGIPAMGHVGLTPQTASGQGGYKAQGRTSADALRLLEDALALQDAGAFCVVVEAVAWQVAKVVSERLTVPTIGIGAGGETGGQVLVLHDLLGISAGQLPRFVKVYGDIGERIRSCVAGYVADVRAGSFPQPEHTYSIPDDELAAFHAAAAN